MYVEDKERTSRKTAAISIYDNVPKAVGFKKDRMAEHKIKREGTIMKIKNNPRISFLGFCLRQIRKCTLRQTKKIKNPNNRTTGFILEPRIFVTLFHLLPSGPA